MTVTYADQPFVRLLFRWRGSIWKCVWRELLIFLALYFAVNLTYRFALPPDSQNQFKIVVQFVERWTHFIPLQFLLGFFVQYIVGRWWDQLMNISWPDRFLLLLTANLPGNDHDTIVVRRTIARWILLNVVLVWKEMCIKIKKRFPSDKHLLKAGLFTKAEFELYNKTTQKYGRWFVPISWTVNLLTALRKQRRITDYGLQRLVSELQSFRGANGMLTMYDWVNAPLRYTQVATFATYGYFALCLIGRQMLQNSLSDMSGGINVGVDLYFPVVTVLEFIFYVGWLKVAEEYRVPFGEDDDDFDMMYILDRNVHVAFMLVDELAVQNPEPCEDIFFQSPNPELPHTKASNKVRDQIPDWRLADYQVTAEEAELFKPEKI